MEGRVWKYGDDINTDLIYPGRYTYVMLNKEEMARHALEDLDESFSREVRTGDILVAGYNWGCGSAREQAVKALTACGISAIIAKGFSRIYFRNALNEGLPAIVCPQAVDAIRNGERITIDMAKNQICTEKDCYQFQKFDSFLQGILADGGLLPHVRRELGMISNKSR